MIGFARAAGWTTPLAPTLAGGARVTRGVTTIDVDDASDAALDWRYRGAMPSLALRPEPSSSAEARRFVQRTLGTIRPPEVVELVALLVAELVTNVVLHARTPMTVRLEFDRSHVRVEVEDRSPDAPFMRRYGTGASTGRGLLLVERLADAWGCEELHDGKIIWFELRDARRSGTLSRAAGDD